MAYRLFDNKPLPESMLAYRQLYQWEQILVKQNTEFTFQKKAFENVVILAGTKQVYEWSVRPPVPLSVRLLVTPFWQCSFHRIIM